MNAFRTSLREANVAKLVAIGRHIVGSNLASAAFAGAKLVFARLGAACASGSLAVFCYAARLAREIVVLFEARRILLRMLQQ